MIKSMCIYQDTGMKTAFLPTGSDTILEELIKEEYDVKVDIVFYYLTCISLLYIPYLNLIALLMLYIKSRYITFKYVLPMYHPENNAFLNLVLTLIPSISYIYIYINLRNKKGENNENI